MGITPGSDPGDEASSIRTNIRTASFRRVENTALAVLWWLPDSHSVTPRGGNVHHLTQRPPDHARCDTPVKRFTTGDIAELRDHDIAQDGSALGGTKLVDERAVKFATRHQASLGALGANRAEIAIELVWEGVGNTRDRCEVFEHRQALPHLDQNF